MPKKIFVGRIDHFYDRINVAALELEEELAVGDTISIENGEDSFKQKVTSMQINKKDVQKARKGDSVGIKTEQRAAAGSAIYKLAASTSDSLDLDSVAMGDEEGTDLGLSEI